MWQNGIVPDFVYRFMYYILIRFVFVDFMSKILHFHTAWNKFLVSDLTFSYGMHQIRTLDMLRKRFTNYPGAFVAHMQPSKLSRA